VLHEAAARFGWQMKDRKDTSREAAEETMNRILDELFREEPWVSRMEEPREAFLGKRIRLACLKTAQLWSEQMERSDFRPSRFEEEFGKTLPGMRMELPDHSWVEWTGMVDRVDVFSREDEDVLRIVDYKSGAKKLSAAGVAEGWQLQLWVYLQTLCRTWEERTGRKAVPGGVYYAPVGDDFANVTEEEGVSDRVRMQGWAVADPDILAASDHSLQGPGDSSRFLSLDIGSRGYLSSQVKSPEDFRVLLDGAVDTARQLAQSMKDGEIAPRALQQGQQSACEYCAYKALCGLQGKKETISSAGERQAMQKLRERLQEGEDDGQTVD